MNYSEIKKKLEQAYNQEDWNIVEDLIDVLDTLITIGEEDDELDWEFEDNEWLGPYWVSIGIYLIQGATRFEQDLLKKVHLWIGTYSNIAYA